MWSTIVVLFPSIAMYFGLSLFLCFCGWFLLKKMYPQIRFPFLLPVGFAILMTIHFTGQSFVVGSLRRPASVDKSNLNTAVSPVDLAKMKVDFLNTLDALLANPQQVTAQMKTEVFNRYGNLFATPEVKKAYENNIGAIYVCQRAFFEDALASLKAKKATKGDIRKRCSEMDGQFFGRTKLIPPEMVKTNDEMIDKIAKGKPIKQGDKEVVADAKVLEGQVTLFNQRVQTVQAMFQ